MFPVKLYGHVIIIKRPHLPIKNISRTYFQKENSRNPKTDTKKQFPGRVTTSLKLLVLPRKKTKNYFSRSTNWLSRFLFKPSHSRNKGGGRLTNHGRIASLYPTYLTHLYQIFFYIDHNVLCLFIFFRSRSENIHICKVKPIEEAL